MKDLVRRPWRLTGIRPVLSIIITRDHGVSTCKRKDMASFDSLDVGYDAAGVCAIDQAQV